MCARCLTFLPKSTLSQYKCNITSLYKVFTTPFWLHGCCQWQSSECMVTSCTMKSIHVVKCTVRKPAEHHTCQYLDEHLSTQLFSPTLSSPSLYLTEHPAGFKEWLAHAHNQLAIHTFCPCICHNTTQPSCKQCTQDTLGQPTTQHHSVGHFQQLIKHLLYKSTL